MDSILRRRRRASSRPSSRNALYDPQQSIKSDLVDLVPIFYSTDTRSCLPFLTASSMLLSTPSPTSKVQRRQDRAFIGSNGAATPTAAHSPSSLVQPLDVTPTLSRPWKGREEHARCFRQASVSVPGGEVATTVPGQATTCVAWSLTDVRPPVDANFSVKYLLRR